MFQKRGNALIEQAVGIFKKVEQDIQEGIQHLNEERDYHENLIKDSEKQSETLRQDIVRSEAVLKRVQTITSV